MKQRLLKEKPKEIRPSGFMLCAHRPLIWPWWRKHQHEVGGFAYDI